MNYTKSLRWLQLLVVTVLVSALAGATQAEGPKWIGAFFVKGKVGLKWQKFEGASEYSIYRKIGDGSLEKIVETGETQYFDTDLTPGKVHVYQIAAVDASGEEVFSEEKSVSIPGGLGSDFNPPTWVGLRTDRRGILLNWDRVKGAVAYNVYRAENAGGPYEVVGSAPSTSYSDYDVDEGKTYYYALTAMNEEFEETEKSEERSEKFGMTAEELAAADTTSIELEETPLTFLFAIEEAGDLGTLNQPFDVFLNSKGDIYVTDTRRFRVDCFDPSGKHKFSFGERTPQDLHENPPDGTFESPMPLYIDKQDQVWVGDNANHNIQVFSADGKFLRKIKIDTGSEDQEFRPNGLAILDNGRILVTDAGMHRLLFLDQDGNIIKEISHGGTTQEEQDAMWFSFPSEVVVSDNGMISVIDQMGARVQQFDTEGNFIRSFGQAGYAAGQFGRPKGITVAEDGRLWISDGMANTIQIFTPEGEVKSAITGSDITEAQLTSPSGMFIRDGRFYLVTRLTGKVLVFEIG